MTGNRPQTQSLATFFLTVMLGLVGAADLSYGYPNYISYGYGSCLSCHYNPYGNGPLTDYGRVVAATEIAGRLGVKPETSDEDLAEESGFLGKKSLASWLRPSASYRGLYLKRRLGSDDEKDSYIHMDASASLVGQWLERDKLTVVVQVSYVPASQRPKDGRESRAYQSREHYVGYRLTRAMGVYAGLMDPVFGIRLPDHILFSRSVTSLSPSEQTHGVLFHYLDKRFEVGLQPFLGNLTKDEASHEKGATSQLEMLWGPKTRLGVSGLMASTKESQRRMFATHGRLGLGRGHSLLAEVGQVSRTTVKDDRTTRSLYMMTQGHWRLARGLWTILTLDGLKPDHRSKASIQRVGPGLQFFPRQRLELRTDAYYTYQVTETKSRPTSWDLTAQVHLWL